MKHPLKHPTLSYQANSFRNSLIQSDRRVSESEQLGFTIVELMIATVVFSLVLVVVVYGVLSFSHAYYSGINASTTQDTTRNIIDSIAESIEFSGTNITTTPSFTPPTSITPGTSIHFCAGNMTYIYNWGVMYTGTPSLSNAGLYVTPGGCQVPSSIPTAGGKELLAPNMRITALTVQGDATGRLYSITLGVAYGESDLLCNASKDRPGVNTAGGCLNNDPLNAQGQDITTNPQNVDDVNDVGCKQTTGFQFCAHAGLSTTVSLRVSAGALN